ncbi:MAG: PHP domain-containing protein [Clostridia bacterium]|nr:PHP domain-containing protein [Clostridia bacterium]
MNRYFYDFHLHSCISPCADNDMTPSNIAGMASLVGLNILALTDHNSVKNTPAFYEACKRFGIIPIAGMELTTAEEIHVVCLFETLEGAISFGDEIDRRRVRIKNRVEIFGDQLIVDAEDNIIGREDDLLPNATTVSLEEVPELVERFGGVCWPAHIDRMANGIIAVLGTFPETPKFLCAELNVPEKKEEYLQKYPILREKRILCSSDSHNLWSIRDQNDSFLLEDEPYSGDLVRSNLFKVLRSAL